MAMPDDPDLTAAELALGVLEGDERAIALRRVLAEPAFAREVERWRTWFAALHADWPAVDPGPAAGRRAMAIPDGAPLANRWWRTIAATSSIAAAALLALLLTRPVQAPVGPPPAVQRAPSLVAVLKPEDGEAFGVVVDRATREVRLSGTVRVPSERAAELWAIGRDGVPRAAGLLAPKAGTRLTLSPTLAIAPGTTLAISIEPAGGSPKPTPTGPVVATGVLAAI